MQYSELVAVVAKIAGVDNDKAEEILGVIETQISGTLTDGEAVSLTGFGTFTKKKRLARKGRNPRTGEALDIPASNAIGFKAGSKLRGVL